MALRIMRLDKKEETRAADMMKGNDWMEGNSQQAQWNQQPNEPGRGSQAKKSPHVVLPFVQVEHHLSIGNFRGSSASATNK